MKRISHYMVAIALLVAVSLLPACGGVLHKPTTTDNAVTSAQVAYSASALIAAQYLKYPLCGAPVVQPCSQQSVRDRITTADNAAYAAVKAAADASATALDKRHADAALASYDGAIKADPVKTAIAADKAKEGAK